jgi:hypothetical protein
MHATLDSIRCDPLPLYSLVSFNEEECICLNEQSWTNQIQRVTCRFFFTGGERKNFFSFHFFFRD